MPSRQPMRNENWRRSILPASLLVACIVFSPPGTSASAGKPEASIAIPAWRIGGGAYVSLGDLARVLGGRLHPYPSGGKIGLRRGGNLIVFTPFSSVVTVNDVGYRLPLETRYHDTGALYVPSEAILALLARTLPGFPKVQPVEKPSRAPVRGIRRPAAGLPMHGTKVDRERWTIDTIILDPGHGGRDPGAKGKRGTKEKDIALKVSIRLKELLEERLGVNAVLTRSTDRFVTLGQRARIARKNQGKLFVSIHCNASRSRRARGFEVYFLSEAKTDEAAEVARRENAVLDLEEQDESGAMDEIESIRFGLLSTQFLKESQDLAADIRAEVVGNMRPLPDRGVRQANFYVMRGTMGHMPSVLVEIGFVSNPAEESQMRKTSYQRKMAEAIFNGIRNFKHRYERQLTRN